MEINTDWDQSRPDSEIQELGTNMIKKTPTQSNVGSEFEICILLPRFAGFISLVCYRGSN